MQVGFLKYEWFKEKGEPMKIFKVFQDAKGQSMVETALILPIIILILFGIIEFGRIFNAYIIIGNASREGVRHAVVGGSDLDIIGTINYNTSMLDAENLSITITPISANRVRGTAVTVQVNYDIDIVVPIISSIIPNPFTLTSKTVMRME